MLSPIAMMNHMFTHIIHLNIMNNIHYNITKFVDVKRYADFPPLDFELLEIELYYDASLFK